MTPVAARRMTYIGRFISTTVPQENPNFLSTHVVDREPCKQGLVLRPKVAGARRKGLRLDRI